jgi:hypothetical protein
MVSLGQHFRTLQDILKTLVLQREPRHSPHLAYALLLSINDTLSLISIEACTCCENNYLRSVAKRGKSRDDLMRIRLRPPGRTWIR